MQNVNQFFFRAPFRIGSRLLKGKNDTRFGENKGCVSVRRGALGRSMSVRWERARQATRSKTDGVGLRVGD
jgi:hypothetical protein